MRGAVVALTLLAASCSGDDGGEAHATTSPSSAAASTTATLTDAAPTTVTVETAATPSTPAPTTIAGTTPAPRQPAVAAATLEGPITTGTPSPPASLQPVDPLAAIGYVEEEYFASGTATAYAAAGELGADGNWDATPRPRRPTARGSSFVARRIHLSSAAWWSPSG